MRESDEEYARSCTSIEPLDLQSEYVRVSADLYYWRGKYADTLDEESKAENLRKDIEAEVYLELREAKDSGKKSGTEEQIKLRMRLDSRVSNARERERQAMVQKARVWGIVESITTKKDMLIGLGASQRQERDLVLRDKKD